jgi:hypothetical protein
MQKNADPGTDPNTIRLKQTISDILSRALAGYTDDYKLVKEGHTYIQWGLVVKDMHAAIDAANVATNVAQPKKTEDTPQHNA